MVSFFEKLKKGMGVEEMTEEPKMEDPLPEIEAEEDEETKNKITEKKQAKKKRVLKVKKIEPVLEEPTKTEEKPEESEEPEEPEEPEEETPEENDDEKKSIEIEVAEPSVEDSSENLIKVSHSSEDKNWFEPEGQLAIDIFQTTNELIVQSAIAGVRMENLDISLERDVMSIKGRRENPHQENGDYFAQECYWGAFSREIILPSEIDPDKVRAKMQDGILTIRMPKILREKKRKIVVTS
ncbi:MAG: Hsp20/alpha crystallin family protein [Candidatus Pacebacteria bacterium]|nr:Hsp20/alpha crystallin family protein [Candidatus Paceibacterota bacterium]